MPINLTAPSTLILAAMFNQGSKAIKEETNPTNPAINPPVPSMPQPSSPPLQQQQPQQPSGNNFNEIVDMLNIIRSGKSFKDPDTHNAFAAIWSQTPPQEQQTVFGFLTKLADAATQNLNNTNKPTIQQSNGLPQTPPAPSQQPAIPQQPAL